MSLDCTPSETENYWKLRERSNTNQQMFQTTVAAALRTHYGDTRVEGSAEETTAILEV